MNIQEAPMQELLDEIAKRSESYFFAYFSNTNKKRGPFYCYSGGDRLRLIGMLTHQCDVIRETMLEDVLGEND